ncbi:MAG TPA: rhomboid family intramembrane serine protease [Solirubrobacteraceae bacterium]|jgi:membrane associated rhomboid family serine protease|nr:rhomboid family intramembrane serine protease [Solirubrobacteraceae bacterium]
MTADAAPRRSPRDQGLLLLAGMAALMWAVEIVDAVAFELDRNGIVPRELDGLDGIVFAPFLHGGFGHLIGNTIPFLLLGAAIALGGLVRVAAVTAIVALVGGLGTWLTGPDGTVHIGASGIVFGYAAYLVSRFMWSRRALDLLLGLVVLAVYGTTLLVGLVPTPGVSWQGHLFGAVGGVVAARVVHRRRAAS